MSRPKISPRPATRVVEIAARAKKVAIEVMDNPRASVEARLRAHSIYELARGLLERE